MARKNTTRWDLAAGRCITVNGANAVTLNRCFNATTGQGNFSPYFADALARRIVELLQRHGGPAPE